MIKLTPDFADKPAQIQATTNSTNQPQVYFRSVNRVHINRFKAYTHIIANRLNAQWLITDDIKSTNIVIETETSTTGKNLLMKVLAGTANTNPPVLVSFKLIFDDHRMIKQLNRASKQLQLANQQFETSQRTENTIKVCGLLNKSLSLICDALNKRSTAIQFIPHVGLISSQAGIYQNQLLFIVDGQSKDSLLAYKTFMSRKLKSSIIIDDLTIAVLKSPDENSNEHTFDWVYDLADAHTQVTMLNLSAENELNVFVNYF